MRAIAGVLVFVNLFVISATVVMLGWYRHSAEEAAATTANNLNQVLEPAER
jgi:hypothetical protein